MELPRHTPEVPAIGTPSVLALPEASGTLNVQSEITAPGNAMLENNDIQAPPDTPSERQLDALARISEVAVADAEQSLLEIHTRNHDTPQFKTVSRAFRRDMMSGAFDSYTYAQLLLEKIYAARQAYGHEAQACEALITRTAVALEQTHNYESELCERAERQTSSLLAKLAARTDWRGALHEYASGEGVVHDAIRAHIGGTYEQKETLPNDRYRLALQRHSHASALYATLEGNGYILPADTPDIPPTPEAPAATPGELRPSMETMARWADDMLSGAKALLSPSRQQFVRGSSERQRLARLSTLAETTTYWRSGEGVCSDVPPALHDALAELYAQNEAAFNEAEATEISHILTGRPTGPLITGTPQITLEYGIDDGAEWVERTTNSIPFHLQAGLGEIALARTDTTRTTRIGGENMVIAGEYIQEDNRAAVYFNTAALFAARFAAPTQPAKQKVTEDFRADQESVLRHEVFHYAHRNVIPLSLLLTWIETVDTDGEPASSYTHDARLPDSEVNYYAEEMAVCGALYCQDPNALKAIGNGKRYEFFHNKLMPVPDWFKQLFPSSSVASGIQQADT